MRTLGVRYSFVIGVRWLIAALSAFLDAGAIAQQVVPDFYREPGLYPNRSYVNQSFNEYIDPFTGALQQHYVDIYIPGNGGFDLKVIRSYNSASVNAASPASYKGIAGLGWTVHFGRVIKPFNQDAPYGKVCENARPANVGDNPALELPDGSRQLLAFTGISSPLMLTAQRWRVECSADGNTVIAYSPDGVRYDMAQKVDLPSGITAWYTTQITDRNNNYAVITYTAVNSPEVKQIVTNDSRTISFSYLESGTSRGRISTISENNQTYSYSYTAVQGVVDTYFLTSVTRPDNAGWSYTYNGLLLGTSAGGFLMNSVTYPEGGVINYGYSYVLFDNTTSPTVNLPAVTSKTTTPGGSWSFSYAPGTLGVYDQTTVSSPTGTTTYRHYGANFASRGSGTVWMIGLLMSKNIAGMQTESYTWGKQKISDEDNFRPNDYLSGRIDTEVDAPILMGKTINRDGSAYTTQYNNPDSFGNPTQVVESGITSNSGGASINTSRTTNYNYFATSVSDALAKGWILHLVKDETVLSASPTYAMPTSSPLTTDYLVGRTYYTGARLGLVQTETRANVSTGYDYYTGTTNGGTLSSVTDANGFATTYSNYKRGTAQTVSRSIDGTATNVQTIARAVNDSGTIASEKDGEDKETSYSYNGINQLGGVSTARVDDSDITITRITGNHPSDTIVRSAYKQVRQYDGFGMPIRSDWSDTTAGTATLPIFQKTDYDPTNRPIRQYLPNSVASYVSTQYDALNRPVLVTQPDGKTIKYDYLRGNLTCVTDERGFRTLYGYRSFGDPSRQELVRIRADSGDTAGAAGGSGSCPASSAVQVTYVDRNLLGQVLSIAQEGITRAYKYNSKFFLFQEDDPELGAIVYTHDNIGTVLSRKVGTSGTTNYASDRLYRIKSVVYPDGTSVVFNYYKNDRLQDVTKGTTRWDYLYDLNNNLTTEKLTVNGRVYPFVNAYDTLDALSSISYPSGLVVSYSPNAFSQPSQVGSGLGTFASSIGYYPNGQLKGFTAGNGYRTDLGQNARLFPSTLLSSTTLNGGITAINLNHLYDAAANTTDIIDNFDSSETRHMTYDGLNRLRVANGAWGAGEFTYDARNNIATKQLGSQSLLYTYNPTTGRLDSINGTYPRAYKYDVYGNVTSNGTAAPYGVFGYDDASNMVRVGSSGTTNYTYDGNSRMAIESWANGSLTRYTAYNHGGQLMYEDDVVNSEATDYIYLGSQLLAKRSRCTSSVDSDGDGISNCAEWRVGMNPYDPSDANADTDRDGLTNKQELALGADPYKTDSDGDGIPDGFEAKHRMNALVSDSNLVTDSSGLTNMQKYQKWKTAIRVLPVIIELLLSD